MSDPKKASDQTVLHAEAELLRDEFLSHNESNCSDALLSACQIILKLEHELVVARQSSSVGYSRSFKAT